MSGKGMYVPWTSEKPNRKDVELNCIQFVIVCLELLSKGRNVCNCMEFLVKETGDRKCNAVRKSFWFSFFGKLQ
jgi:hypothetical protein